MNKNRLFLPNIFMYLCFRGWRTGASIRKMVCDSHKPKSTVFTEYYKPFNCKYEKFNRISTLITMPKRL